MVVQASASTMRQVQGSRLVAYVKTLSALADMLGVSRKSCKLKMLFSTDESGWRNVSAFHSSCDDKGPTISLIRSSDGSSYGGYTSVSWVSYSVFRHDSQAFLFRLSPQQVKERSPFVQKSLKLPRGTTNMRSLRPKIKDQYLAREMICKPSIPTVLHSTWSPNRTPRQVH